MSLFITCLFWIVSFTSAVSLKHVGTVALPDKTQIEGVTVGGLSGLTYDKKNQIFYAVSDSKDQFRIHPFKLEIEKKGNLEFAPLAPLLLKTKSGKPFSPDHFDLEGLIRLKNGHFIVSSEGLAPRRLPSLTQFSEKGQEVRSVDLPKGILFSALQSADAGSRSNADFESLTLTPSEKNFYTALEQPLYEDSGSATTDSGALVRIFQYQLSPQKIWQVQTSNAYPLDPVPPLFDSSFSDVKYKHQENGLAELLALDESSLLALERSFSKGEAIQKDSGTRIEKLGNSIRLYEVRFNPTLDISPFKTLFDLKREQVLQKKLVLNLDSVIDEIPGHKLDNFEGMSFGPMIRGKQTIVLVSDDNFNPAQRTLFSVFTLEP